MPLARLAFLGAILLLGSTFIPAFPPLASAGENMIQAKMEDFDPEASIHVCWRLVRPGNPFLVEGPFDCGATVSAVKAPFPGGGLNGDQLMAVARKAAGDQRVNEVRVRSLTAGKDAADPGANLMTVDAGPDEFYNNYVGRDGRGRLVIFLDIELAAE